MTYHKYPRTPHFPFSRGFTSDDIIATSYRDFEGEEVVITEKMDGENSSLYSDHYHARSLDSRHHASRDWLKAFHGNIAYKIPKGWRVCGENMFAKHSIFYAGLKSYFYGFSIWDENNVALGWDATLMWFEELGITPVPRLLGGIFNENMLSAVVRLANTLDLDKQEGFVMRKTTEIPYDNFDKSFMKWVRPKHVQTDEHWMHAEIVPNELEKT